MGGGPVTNQKTAPGVPNPSVGGQVEDEDDDDAEAPNPGTLSREPVPGPGDPSGTRTAADTGDLNDIRKRLARLDPTARAREQRWSALDSQAAWDKALGALGLQAERPLSGEDGRTFDIRMMRLYQSYSPEWKPVDCARLDDQTLAIARSSVFRALEQEG